MPSFPPLCKTAFSVCTAALLISAVLPAASAETIKIALPGPMTGPVTQYGDMVRAGAMTAIEQLNATAGTGGNQFELVPMDEACEPKQAVSVANKIVSQGIKFVVGHLCSGATIAASDIYENEGIVMISPSATAPQLTEAKPRNYIFRTIGRDDQQAPTAAHYIAQKLKPKKVAILHDKQSYGQGLARSVKATLEADKVPVVLFEGINAGESDYSALITKLKAQSVDVIYYGGYFPEMGLLMRQAREQGLKAIFVGPEGAGNKNLNAIAGPAAEGMLLTQPSDFSADPANAAIKQAFLDKHRDPVGGFQLPTYAALQVIAAAITGAHSSDPTKVAAYIHSHAFKTAIGTIEFTPKGDLKFFKFDVYTWHKDGTSTLAAK
ncbi:MAG TPA: high-affinity branched-chain amino acid ABC transporter substrate-binding protein [Herbaspirillum sp.]|jgi:branched-chain amino acid transport system substrate-binding protein|nr:high-affinity branched-chain amino acid ABC transporter substrate-binding protein [Herbaspirillum sp.]